LGDRYALNRVDVAHHFTKGLLGWVTPVEDEVDADKSTRGATRPAYNPADHDV
jgi:hypothetical protein